MNTISRRLRKLEDILGPPIETEFSRLLRERLEAGRRRVAELRGEPVEVRRHEHLAHAPTGIQTIVEILQSGRRRARLSGAERAIGAMRPESNDPN